VTPTSTIREHVVTMIHAWSRELVVFDLFMGARGDATAFLGRREKCRKDPRNLFKFWRETATLQRQAGRPTTPSGGIRKESSAATSGDGTVGFYSLGPLQPRGASFKQSQSGGPAGRAGGLRRWSYCSSGRCVACLWWSHNGVRV
jgi:hypothetical protein